MPGVLFLYTTSLDLVFYYKKDHTHIGKLGFDKKIIVLNELYAKKHQQHGQLVNGLLKIDKSCLDKLSVSHIFAFL